MNAEIYKMERKLHGTQIDVAAQLGVTQVTMARRETGVVPITREMMLALCALPKLRKKKPMAYNFKDFVNELARCFLRWFCARLLLGEYPPINPLSPFKPLLQLTP